MARPRRTPQPSTTPGPRFRRSHIILAIRKQETPVTRAPPRCQNPPKHPLTRLRSFRDECLRSVCRMCIRPDSGSAAGAVAGLFPLRPSPAPLASGCLVRADEYVHPVLDIHPAVTRAVVQALDERENVTGRRLPVG